MNTLDQLLNNNREWAKNTAQRDPEFFTRSAAGQSPSCLWVGCSDSRVPASQLVGAGPGELFVHRNISNVIVHSDLNCLSVMQYAVEVLKVGHIIICGHYGCGGVLAALRNEKHGLIDNWLRHVQEVGLKYQAELGALESEAERHRRLCELNVVEQVANVSRTTIVQDAWARGQTLSVHGWIYELQNGQLQDLDVSVSG
ncbi:MAG TPA: carbonate dehydratase [Gammaproteobacteria bacterium]|nr:carbonate dehydratase [Gammaproteobacteria bacterium]